VVSSGQFLIDSESSIREAAAKMVEPKSMNSSQGKEEPKQGMEGMVMPAAPEKDMQMDAPKVPEGSKPVKPEGMPMDHMGMEGMK